MEFVSDIAWRTRSSDPEVENAKQLLLYVVASQGTRQARWERARSQHRTFRFAVSLAGYNRPHDIMPVSAAATVLNRGILDRRHVTGIHQQSARKYL